LTWTDTVLYRNASVHKQVWGAYGTDPKTLSLLLYAACLIHCRSFGSVKKFTPSDADQECDQSFWAAPCMHIQISSLIGTLQEEANYNRTESDLLPPNSTRTIYLQPM
jgi:hypothetical protein